MDACAVVENASKSSFPNKIKKVSWCYLVAIRLSVVVSTSVQWVGEEIRTVPETSQVFSWQSRVTGIHEENLNISMLRLQADKLISGENPYCAWCLS